MVGTCRQRIYFVSGHDRSQLSLLSSPYPTVDTFFQLGKIIKSHGTAGHLRMIIEDQFKIYIKPGVFVFVDQNGSKVPYRIKGTEDAAHFVISLDEVTTKQESDLLSGRDLWIPLTEVKSRHQRSPRNIKDKWYEYQIVEDLTGRTFDVIRVEEFPQQLMAVIQCNNKEMLIPLSEQLISGIDKIRKIINMKIPEGLLDL